jgi:hypothetical protein
MRPAVNFRTQLIALVTGVLLTASAMAEDTIGVVKRSKGYALVERQGMSMMLQAGTHLLRGDRVVTGADGYINIHMLRAAPLSVGPNASVALNRYAALPTVVSRPAPPLLQGLASFLGINRQR